MPEMRTQQLLKRQIGCIYISSIIFGFFTTAHANTQPGNYYTRWGSDSVIFYQPNRGCFTSLKGSCVQGVNQVNSFAVEWEGILFCHNKLTPVIDQPLIDFYGPPGSKSSGCTIKGWKHLKNNY